MKKRGMSLIGGVFVALILLVIVFLVRLTLQRPVAVVLPELPGTESGGSVASEPSQDSIRRVEVTPETVQRVIERLARPESYRRTITLERFWQEGSGQTGATVRVLNGWTRTDLSGGDGTQKHVITGDDMCWVWYGSDARVFSGTAAFTADEEQGIPTYEDILRLPVDRITAADYRVLDGVKCVYAETAEDAFGYRERYWVSVENGLLVCAERLEGEEVVYRMKGMEIVLNDVDAQAFSLPDGSNPYPGAEDRGRSEHAEKDED